MISIDNLAEAFARNANIVKMQTKDLTHEDSLRQQPTHGNCLNWVVGHLIENRDAVLKLLGEPPEFGALGERYKRGSEVLTESNESVLRLEELLAWLDRSQTRVLAALSRTDEAALAREITTSHNRTATVGQRIFFLYFHETYHVGQTELFRQLAGKHDKVI